MMGFGSNTLEPSQGTASSQRHVTMARVGEIGNLRSFNRQRLENRDAQRHELLRNSSALHIQTCWNRFQAQRMLGTKLARLFLGAGKFLNVVPNSGTILLIRDLPLSLRWRHSHSKMDDRDTAEDFEKLHSRPSMEQLMEFILIHGKSKVAKKATFIGIDRSVLTWKESLGVDVSESALPPVWRCVARAYLNYLTGLWKEHSHSDFNLVDLRAIVILNASYPMGTDEQNEYCSCEDTWKTLMQPRQVSQCMMALLLRSHPKTSRIQLASVLKFAVKQSECSYLIDQILTDLLNPAESGAKYDCWKILKEAVTEGLEDTEVRRCCFFSLLREFSTQTSHLGKPADSTTVQKWKRLIRMMDRFTSFVQVIVASFPEGENLKSSLTSDENSELTMFAFEFACEVAKHMSRIPKALLKDSNAAADVLPLLTLCINNVKLDRNDKLKVTMRNPLLLDTLFSFGRVETNQKVFISRLKIIFPPNNLSRFFKRVPSPLKPISHLPPTTNERGRQLMASVIQNFIAQDDDSAVEESSDEFEGAERRHLAKANATSKFCIPTGFVEPIDLAVFDELTLTTSFLPQILLNIIGTELFDTCSGKMSKFLERMGPSPSFNSDVGLVCKVWIDMVLRKFLLVDDSQFGISTEMTSLTPVSFSLEEARDVWRSLSPSIFPLKARQMLLISLFVKHLAFSLLYALEGWASKNNVFIKRRVDSNSTTSELSTMANDTASFSRLLFKRGRRLRWAVKQGEIFRATQLLRSNITFPRVDALTEPELFDDLLPPLPRQAVPETVVKVLCCIPHAIPFVERVAVFQDILRDDRRSRGRPDNFTPYTAQCLTLRRLNLIEDALMCFRNDALDLRAAFRVRFVDESGSFEQGVDGGGLFREFLAVAASELFSPDKGLFRVVEGDGSLLPNDTAFELMKHEEFTAEECFKLAGILIGKALYESVVLGAAEINPLFLNRVLGGTNTFDDLQYSDSEVYRNIKFVRDYEGDVSELGLFFSVSPDTHQVKTEIPLIVNGSFTPVINSNKLQYCLFLSHYLGNKVLDRSAKAFLAGLTRVISLNWLQLFDPADIQELIAGKKEVGFDCNELRPFTTYGEPYNDTHPVVKSFWQFLADESPEFRAKFLHFVTASDRMPLLGFATLTPPFAIVPTATGSVEELPSASTCVNVLRLPNYVSAEQLRQKMQQAVHGASGFHLA